MATKPQMQIEINSLRAQLATCQADLAKCRAATPAPTPTPTPTPTPDSGIPTSWRHNVRFATLDPDGPMMWSVNPSGGFARSIVPGGVKIDTLYGARNGFDYCRYQIPYGEVSYLAGDDLWIGATFTFAQSWAFVRLLTAFHYEEQDGPNNWKIELRREGSLMRLCYSEPPPGYATKTILTYPAPAAGVPTEYLAHLILGGVSELYVDGVKAAESVARNQHTNSPLQGAQFGVGNWTPEANARSMIMDKARLA